MSGMMLRPSDHVMVGVTSIGLFVCYKMFSYAPVYALLLTWFNMAMFNTYCLWRKNENM